MEIINNQGTTLKSEYHDKHITFDVTYTANNTPKPVVLFVHGFKGFKDWGHFPLIAREFAYHNFVFIKMNVSHNGTTPKALNDFVDLEAFGQNNFTIELADIKVLLDHLMEGKDIPEEEVNLNSLNLIGHSRGGTTSIIYSTLDKRITSLTTWAAVCHVYDRYTQDEQDKWKKEGVKYIFNSRTNQQMPMYYQLAKDLMVNKSIYNIPEIADKILVPYKIIHGNEDTTVNFKEAEALQRMVKQSELSIINGADHTFGGKHPWEDEKLPKDSQLLCNLTLDFLSK